MITTLLDLVGGLLIILAVCLAVAALLAAPWSAVAGIATGGLLCTLFSYIITKRKGGA
jgi:hypothetical protein